MTNESPGPGGGSAQDFETYCPPALRPAAEQLTPLLYKDLRKMARRERFQLCGGATLSTTALVHETYLRLANNPGFESQSHFLRVAAIVMRRALVDRVREQLAQKRGAGAQRVPLEEADAFVVEDDELVFGVHEALQRLAAASPRLAEIVQCRFFAGYTDAQIATAMDISERTVRRDWTLARAWLMRELGEQSGAAVFGGDKP